MGRGLAEEGRGEEGRIGQGKGREEFDLCPRKKNEKSNPLPTRILATALPKSVAFRDWIHAPSSTTVPRPHDSTPRTASRLVQSCCKAHGVTNTQPDR